MALKTIGFLFGRLDSSLREPSNLALAKLTWDPKTSKKKAGEVFRKDLFAHLILPSKFAFHIPAFCNSKS